MDWINDLNWFAVQSKPHQERLAAARLAALDLEVFLPRVRQEQEVCGALRLVSKPLFPGYFFARFRPLLSYEAVRYALGVLRVVGNHPVPFPIEPAVVDVIRARVQEDGYVPLDHRPFRPGDKVLIEQGPLGGWMGRVEREPDDRRRVAILLDTLQQMRVLVEARCLVAAGG